MKLISGSNRISVDNTLDERLRLLEDRVRLASHHSEFWLITTMQMLPEIRKDLFGINENRKFYT